MAAKTNAERQRDYRERHLHGEGGTGERLNMVIGLHTKRSLERLAACYGVTQRVILERIIAQAEQQAIECVLTKKGSASGYYDKTLQIEPDVTP